MSSETQILDWKSKELPSDNLCLQNAVSIANSIQTPFIIDPNNQANAWLKAYLSVDIKPEITQQSDSRFTQTLENCIRFGKKLIVNECNGLMPMLVPVVRRDLIMAGQRQVVQIGDHQVDWNEGFKVFLVTRHANPDIPDNLSAFINPINFTITRSGLEEQLLATVLRHEQPGLEQKKSDLLAREESFKLQQSALEKTLLETLASSEGNILENTKLIESLNKTKEASVEIESSLIESRTIQVSLNKQRDGYRPVASNGSMLYFLVDQLASVNNMYQFSLPGFLRLFKSTLDVSRPEAKSDDPKANAKAPIVFLRAALKMKIFRYVCRSIFKADRLMFGLHLIHSLHGQLFQV